MAVFLGFTGEYTYALDAKGRLALPVRYRAHFKSGVVVTIGVEICLYAYPPEAWGAKARQIEEGALSAAQRRQVERAFFGRACELELDAQSRITLPSRQRAYAHLENETVIVGARDRLEIWNPGLYQEAMKQANVSAFAGLDLPF
jgi:MraZ protein